VKDDSVETIRRWFDALHRGDPAPEMCDPEIEIPAMPRPGARGGRPGSTELRTTSAAP
jgi:hypothetical protein